MGIRSVLLIGLVGLALFVSTLHSDETTPQEAATQDFTYQGEPIHPVLVYEFEGWLSDGGPITVAVDIVSAHGSDEYYQPDVVIGADNTYAFRPSEREYYSYQWLGRLDNGTHVVRTAYSGGGSGVFMSLLFLHINEGIGFTPEGEQQERLVLSISQWYPLGDRVSELIELRGNKVLIGPGERHKEQKTLTIELPK